jgi:FMN phosphatase YigB (HAD superfamily)
MTAALFARAFAAYALFGGVQPDTADLLRPGAGRRATCRRADRLSRRAVLGLLTSGIASDQRSRIAAAGIGVFISEGIGVTKPDPAVLHFAARELHVAPYKLLRVGDNPWSDIRSGHAAGMPTCWVNRRGRLCPPDYPLPDYVVGSLEGLLALAPPLS